MDKMIDRIVKLLAKAESTNAHEAEAIMAKVEDLMIRHSIELLDVERAKGATQVKPEQIIKRTRKFEGKSYAKVRCLMALHIAKAMGLQSYYQGSRDMRTYTTFIVGYERDVEDCMLLIESLDLQAATAMREWWSVERHDWEGEGYRAQRIERRTFIEGFGSTAAQRIKAKREVVVSEYKGTGTELAVIDREKAVRDYVSATVTLGTGRASASGSGSSRAAGNRAGASANIGGKSVGGRSSIGR